MTGIGAVFYRDYRQRMTNIGFVFWDLFVPLAYLVLFGIGFERMLGSTIPFEDDSFSYTEFFLPGVLGMVTFSVAMNTAWGFFMDKDSGIFYEMLTYPITRAQVLIGKISFNVLLAVIGSILAIVLGVVAMDIRIRWNLLPLTALIVVAATAGWFFLFSVFAIKLARMDSFNTVLSAAYILLMFFSSMFYPLSDVPGWFRVGAYLNPMTWQVDLLRFSLLGVGSANVLLLEGAAVVVFAAICLILAVRALNRAG
ncbi:MAG TPA: ABC transporter permease [Pyrinomonadaceae bacterium]|nr:ABC transporter permease [Pyrinomonadaceae bacterium]